jgi:hypothetical protein
VAGWQLLVAGFDGEGVTAFPILFGGRWCARDQKRNIYYSIPKSSKLFRNHHVQDDCSWIGEEQIMADITFEEILQAVQRLSQQEKAILAQTLEMPPLHTGPTREELLAELESMRAEGAFAGAASLRNKFADPALDHLTNEQLSVDIHEAAIEWEKELDEFFGDED